jgi:hypothetical protein
MITSEFVLVNPGMAKRMLGEEVTANFRRFRQMRVDRLARDMVAGKWVDDGSPLRFNSKGQLVDGQHRLRALAQAGVTIRFLTVHGCDEDSAIDTDVFCRTLDQHLEAEGEELAPQMASLLRLALAWTRDSAHVHGAARLSTIQECLALLHGQDGDGIRNAVRFSSENRGDCLMPRSLIGLLHFVVCKHGLIKEVSLFFDRFNSDVDQVATDPVRLLRQRLLAEKLSKTSLPREEILALLIIAWNKWLSGTPVSSLRWRSVGPAAMPFPTISIKKDC